MGRSPCCDGDTGLKKGPWTAEEDQKLSDYVNTHGSGNWKALPKLAGLNRCGKSCRLRWANYLRPDIIRGKFSAEEDRIIINLHSVLGNKWSKIASNLPGRTDNEIKNYWNTHMRKKLLKMGIDPDTHQPRTDVGYHLTNLSQLLCAAQLGNMMNPYESILKLQADAAQAAQIQLIQNLLRIINTSTLPTTSIQNNEATGLLGWKNDYTIEELHGSISILHDRDANAPTPQQILNTGLASQECNGSQSNTNSGSYPESCFVRDAYKSNGTGLSSSKGIQIQNQLPQLVSSPSPNEISSHQMVHSKIIPEGCSTESSTSPCFDTWEKFLDDSSSDSYWKEILDVASLLSPTSGSNATLQHIDL